MHASAVARFAVDRIAAAQAFDALLHAAQAEACDLAGMDSATVVAHAQRQLPASLGGKLDRDLTRLRVAHRVGEALLQAAIDGEIDGSMLRLMTWR